jgi:hypothetical protein
MMIISAMLAFLDVQKRDSGPWGLKCSTRTRRPRDTFWFGLTSPVKEFKRTMTRSDCFITSNFICPGIKYDIDTRLHVDSSDRSLCHNLQLFHFWGKES